MPFTDPTATRIATFIESIGIPLVSAPIAGDTLLPAMTVRFGVLYVDPERLDWPGDMLHEAGHIAVTPPEARASLCAISSDPGEEMSAIAWSYAAAVALDLDPAVVFHPDGYKGQSDWLIGMFTGGTYLALPLLQYYGLTHDARTAVEKGTEPYPAMQRWLR